MAVIIPLVCFIIPLLAGFYAVRHQMRWVVPALMIIGIGVMIWAIWKGQQAQGWDGIGYAILAILMALPAVLGAGVGGLIGWWRNRRARRKASLDGAS